MFVLIDKQGNIVDRYDTPTLDEAKHYFVGRKQIPYESFIQLWEIISDEEHELRVRNKKLKSESNQYNKLGDGEFGDWLDMEKS